MRPGIQLTPSVLRRLKVPRMILFDLVAQSYPTLCDPMDCSPPGSYVLRILQARILEWVAIPFSWDLPDPGIEPRSLSLQADSLPSEPLLQGSFSVK